jgi:hypothetical protein
MTYIRVIIIGFVILETANVLALYFFPDSKLANSVGVFKAWERSQQDPDMQNFTSYLVNWVAGTKLIFILLLLVILYKANDQMLLVTAVALAISISSFFWRLFPLARKMDQEGQIDPPGYSSVLGWMILAIIILLVVAAFFSISG